MINVQVVGDALFAAGHSQGAKSPAVSTSAPSNSESLPSTKVKVTQDSDATSVTPLGQEELIRQSYLVLNSLKNQDYLALSGYVHPQKGLTLTPYSTVDPQKDKTLQSGDIAKAAKNDALYVWGFHDGSGAPIQLSISDYFKTYVYNADYSKAPMIGVNTVLSMGNSLENVQVAYPDAQFVEFYFPSLDPKYNGLDWCGLKLVFEQVLQEYKLVGLIHSEWTI